MRVLAALAALVLSLAPVSAVAGVAGVKSGEHPDFTRIVVEAGADASGDWQFGRTADGYELALGPEVDGYDLAAAFDRIPKDRVSGLWRDPESGRLRLSLSCACHAIAFEFRPGIVVIDVKSGAAPEGSAFEEPLGDALAAEPAGQGYDWLALGDATRAAPAPALVAPEAAPEAVSSAALDPLRAALLEQIARGVAEGVVDVAENPDLGSPGAGLAEAPGLRIAVGELPGVRARGPQDPADSLTDGGAACLPDSQFAVADWIGPGPVAAQIGPGRSGLLEEFDTPKTPAVLRAARLYIALGFGAEALQTLALLGAPDDEATILLQMAGIVDLDPVAQNALAGQEGCDTSAALWSALTLAISGDEPARRIHGDSVARAFSALPAHLRRHLGTPLMQLFLDRGDTGTARLLRDATLRAPLAGAAGAGEEGAGDAAAGLMDAGYRLATGDAEGAAEGAQAVLEAGGGAGPEAVVTLVEAAFAGARTVPPDLPATVAAYLIEARGTAREAPLARAMVLAQAMAGRYADAFAALPHSPETAADLWTLAADGAPDDDFLRAAVGPPAGEAADATALAVASRLQALGFPQQALDWLDRGPGLPEGARMVAARAHLALRDARAAILVLEGDGSPAAEDIRARALLQLGDALAAASAFDRADLTEAAEAARRAAADWPVLAELGAEPWKTAATHTLPAAAPAAAGPLAAAATLAEDSAATVASLAALLESLPAASTP